MSKRLKKFNSYDPNNIYIQVIISRHEQYKSVPTARTKIEFYSDYTKLYGLILSRSLKSPGVH